MSRIASANWEGGDVEEYAENGRGMIVMTTLKHLIRRIICREGPPVVAVS
jgi:hypothetical protein